MLEKLKRELRAKVPLKYKHYWHLLCGNLFGFGQTSYAQFGEDMILQSIFRHQAKGFYVDIGAFHPKWISNTHYFYKLGWRGINIDATSGTMRTFRKVRPRDINLELAISDTKEQMTIYYSGSRSLNTLSKQMLVNRALPIEAEKKISTVPLSLVLDEYVPPNQQIDFFSIDVEGFDLAVLRSNNWEKYKPKAIVVESDMKFSPDQLPTDPIALFLQIKGYKLIAITPANLIFTLNSYTIQR